MDFGIQMRQLVHQTHITMRSLDPAVSSVLCRDQQKKPSLCFVADLNRIPEPSKVYLLKTGASISMWTPEVLEQVIIAKESVFNSGVKMTENLGDQTYA